MFDRPSRLPLRRTRQHKTNRPNLARTWRIIATVTLVALASVYVAFAAISLSTSIPYTQNFTSMGIPVSNPAPSNLSRPLALLGQSSNPRARPPSH